MFDHFCKLGNELVYSGLILRLFPQQGLQAMVSPVPSVDRNPGDVASDTNQSDNQPQDAEESYEEDDDDDEDSDDREEAESSTSDYVVNKCAPRKLKTRVLRPRLHET